MAAMVDPQPVSVGTHGSAGGNIMAAVDPQPGSVGTYGGKTVAAKPPQAEVNDLQCQHLPLDKLPMKDIIYSEPITIDCTIFSNIKNTSSETLSACIVQNFELKYPGKGWGDGPPSLFDSGCNVSGVVIHGDFARKNQFKVKYFSKSDSKPNVKLADGRPVNVIGKIDHVFMRVEDRIFKFLNVPVFSRLNHQLIIGFLSSRDCNLFYDIDPVANVCKLVIKRGELEEVPKGCPACNPLLSNDIGAKDRLRESLAHPLTKNKPPHADVDSLAKNAETNDIWETGGDFRSAPARPPMPPPKGEKATGAVAPPVKLGEPSAPVTPPQEEGAPGGGAGSFSEPPSASPS